MQSALPTFLLKIKFDRKTDLLILMLTSRDNEHLRQPRKTCFLLQLFLDLFFCMTIDTMMKTTTMAETAMIISNDIFGPPYCL